MKRLLRHAACVAAMLLLIVSPVKALAASITQVPYPVGVATSNQATSKFAIEQIEKYQYVFLTVMDDGYPDDPTDNIPLSGVEVQLTYGSSSQDVEDFQGVGVKSFQGDKVGDSTSRPSNITDKDGKIWFRFPKGQTACRIMFAHQDGFHNFDEKYTLDTLNPKSTNLGLLSFKPILLTVTYDPGAHGTISPDQVRTEARWGRAPKAIPSVVVNPDYALDYWMYKEGQEDKKVKDLNQLKVTEDLELTAHYSRQYLVKYEAKKYGYLDGDLQERVIVGEKPKHVPTPVPMSTREYWFVEWRVAGMFTSKSVEPSSMNITGDITFEAIFDVRKRQPVIVPPAPPGESPAAPAPEPSAAVPAGGGIGGGTGGGPANLFSKQLPSGQEESPAAPGREEPAVTSGGEEQPAAPGQAERPGENPPAQEAVQANPDAHSDWQFWLVLLGSLLTLAAGTLRLKVIKGLKRPKDREELRTDGLKPIVTEAIVGIICVVLWGSFYVTRSGPLDLAALALWGVILLAEAVLLIRAEYRLWHDTPSS